MYAKVRNGSLPWPQKGNLDEYVETRKDHANSHT
jgi:hypothetical protein